MGEVFVPAGVYWFEADGVGPARITSYTSDTSAPVAFGPGEVCGVPCEVVYYVPLQDSPGAQAGPTEAGDMT